MFKCLFTSVNTPSRKRLHYYCVFMTTISMSKLRNTTVGTGLGTVMEILNESINFRVRSKLPSKFSNAQKLFIPSARRLPQPLAQRQAADPAAQSAEEKCWGH